MGTRHLTIVIKDNEPKIAQYGQWDGYPSGQGETILAFLLTADLEKFKSKVEELGFFGDSKADKKQGKIIENDVNWTKNYPWLSRDMGGDILECVYNDEPTTKLQNEYDFARDSLFCEWAYVVDLDKNTFEVYQGFNDKIPLVEGDRFYHLMKDMEDIREGNEYYPVRLVREYSLETLPTVTDFLYYFENLAKEEEAQYIRKSYNSGTTNILKWINNYNEMNKGFPKAEEIIGQLELQIEEEIVKEIDEQQAE